MEATIIQVMSKQEAEVCLSDFQAHLSNAAALAQDFVTRRGWEALGYDDLRTCLIDKLHRHGYRLFKLYEVRSNLAFSPVGQNADELRERHVRESHIDDLPPAQQIEAFATAKQLAATEQRPLQATHVTQAVAQVISKATVFQSSYPIVTHMVVSGHITADTGREMVVALDKLKPRQRGHIAQLMSKHGLTCPALIEPIAGMFDRQPGKESLVLPEVMRGFLGNTPLKKATITDLRNANEEARQQHIADAFDQRQEEQPWVRPEIVTIYKGDPQRTLAALRSALGGEIYNLRDLLMEE